MLHWLRSPTAFRAALVRRGEQPRRNSLRTLVPVSIRANDAVDAADNRVSIMLPFLPVDKEDPAEQLAGGAPPIDRAKGSGQRQAGGSSSRAVNVVPFPLTAWAVRALTRLPQRGVVTVATNVPGPRQRLRIMGREVVRMFSDSADRTSTPNGHSDCQLRRRPRVRYHG